MRSNLATYSAEKIDYTDYCKKKLIEETDISIVEQMHNKLKVALIKNSIHGRIDVIYYTDGTAKVNVNGEYYNMFNAVKGEFFKGAVGNYSKRPVISSKQIYKPGGIDDYVNSKEYLCDSLINCKVGD